MVSAYLARKLTILLIASSAARPTSKFVLFVKMDFTSILLDRVLVALRAVPPVWEASFVLLVRSAILFLLIRLKDPACNVRPPVQLVRE